MAAPLALALTGTTMGWVTQVQSKFGVKPEAVAMSFNGSLANNGVLNHYDTLGYYWHHPVLSDDNRGLGGGIAWAFDDELCVINDVRTEQEVRGHLQGGLFLRLVRHLHGHPGVAAPRL